MYLSYYSLSQKPFQINSNPAFLWLGEKHKEALATLRYAVMDNKGFLLITGDVGTGKTTLINALVSSFNSGEVLHAIVTDPNLTRMDFFNIVAHAFKIPKRFETKADFLVYFSRFLHFQNKKGKKVVLIIDESQRLSQELLEEIRLLSNIERQDQKLLNIFFLGQNEFHFLLEKHENRPLLQRITLKYHLEPLTREETEAYIEHRLKVAGCPKMFFTPGALKKINRFSMGYPRLINVVCDHALLTGYVYEKPKIDGKIIEECKKDLEIKKYEFVEKQESRQPERHTGGRQSTSSKGGGSISGFYLLLSLLLPLLLVVLVLTYYFRNDPIQPIRKEIHTLQKMIVQMDKKQDRKENRHKIAPEKHRVPEINEPIVEQNMPQETPKNDLTVPSRSNTSALEAAVSGSRSTAMYADKRLKDFLARTGNPFVLYFKYNSNDLAEQDYSLLNRFVEYALPVKNVKIVVKGRTDSSGSTVYNMKLSEFRANIVKSYLVGKGISAENIQTEGKGGQPAEAEIDTISARAAKRRVEISVVLDRK